MEFSPASKRNMTCSFTGHRPSKLPFLLKKNSCEYEKLYDILKEEIINLIQNGVIYFQSGMAQGIDLMCAEIVLQLKTEFDIHLFCVIPCIDQCAGWENDDIELYNRIISSATGVTYVTNETYARGCMMKRNRYLVDNSDYILSVFDGKKGGTKFTIEYAKKNKKNIIIINPKDYTKVELFHGEDKGVFYV